jgi:hypothetical protein
MAAGVKTALGVIDEADTVANHADRLKLAFAVIEDPGAWGVRLATACISNAAGFTMTPPDDAVEYTVATLLWTKLALAFAASKVV